MDGIFTGLDMGPNQVLARGDFSKSHKSRNLIDFAMNPFDKLGYRSYTKLGYNFRPRHG